MMRLNGVVLFCLIVVICGWGCGSKDVDLPLRNTDLYNDEFTGDGIIVDSGTTEQYSGPDETENPDDATLPKFIPGTRNSRVFYLDSFDLDDTLDEGEKGAGTQKTQIECQLFLPDGPPPYPCMLVGHGWPGNLSQMKSLAKLYQKNGYATLAWSARGYGNSGGLARLNSPEYEVKDVIRLINWLAVQDFVIWESGAGKAFGNGKLVDFDFNNDGAQEPDDIPGDERNDFVVGMAGASYGGAIQLLTAAFDRRVDCIAPWLSWNDLYESLGPGGILKFEWISFLYIGGQLMSNRTVDPLLTEWVTGIMAENDFDIEGLESGLLKRSPATYLHKIRIPTFIIQGENDTIFDINQGVANFETLRENIEDIKMYWNTAGHSGMDLTRLASDGSSLISRMMNWYDRYLKGDDIDTGPEFEYDIEVDGEWMSAFGWWPMVEEEKGYCLVGQDEVGLQPVEDTEYSSDYSKVRNIPFINLNRNTFFNMATQPENEISYDNPLISVSFDTEPFEEGTEITGIPYVHVYLTANTEDIVFFFKIYDVYTNRFREVKELINGDVTPFRIQLSEEDIVRDDSEIADKAKLYNIDLRGFAHYFSEGHRLRLTITTSQSGFMHSRVVGEGYICHDSDHVSELFLPVVE